MSAHARWGWLARVGETLLERKRRPWHRAPLPIVLAVLAVAGFAGCTAPEPEASVAGALSSEADAGPVAVIEILSGPPALPGEPVRFDGSDSEGAIAVWSWSFGDDVTSVETDPVAEHAFKQPGEYVVVLVVRDQRGREDYDVSRVLVVPKDAALEVQEAARGGTGSGEPIYVWEEPKYRDAFESVGASTLPLPASPYAAGVGGTWIQADFAPDDATMLLEGLVVYQDYTGAELCSDRNSRVGEWLYNGEGRYSGRGEECGARAGLATQVYVGICVEFDGELVPEEKWVRVGDVIFGDKMDDCWSRVVKIP